MDSQKPPVSLPRTSGQSTLAVPIDKKVQQKSTLVLLLIFSVLSPLLLLATLISGILGLAYDTSHAAPNILQNIFGYVFMGAFYGAMTIGPVLSLSSIVISAVNLKVFSRKLTVITIVLLSILLALPILAWGSGIISIPSSN